MFARRSVRLVLPAAAALLLCADAAAAQRVVQGFARINQSDVTGPALTSGDQLLFEFGTVQSVSCAAAWGLRTEGRELDQEMYSLTLGTVDGSGRVVWEAAQRDVARLLAGGREGRLAGRTVLRALTPPRNADLRARRAAGELVERLEGLLAEVGRMDPRDPGRGAPTRLYGAVGAWDEFVDASTPAFLADPTDEMLAIQAVLSRLTYAAIRHAARDGDAYRADAFGLACAPVLPVAVEVPVVEELPFDLCVLSGGDFRSVAGVHLPATGDSLVEVDGVRRPLREAYPDRDGYAMGAPWFGRDLPITVGGREYRQWGMSRVVRPGDLVPLTEHRGVRIFMVPGERVPADVVYVPFRSGCEVQPYRRAAEIHRVRG
jgi:hypothetical protein